MPCWYYEKKDLRGTASFKDGINADVEARYRREGARFIIDAGTKMGLRYDTCSTGVVYFHRFYMFHSFREFHRYVTAACCLFLAGKVEETPKKCKDIIKVTRSMLTEAQFGVFGEDPREEVMTMERILLQTIKFDLTVEHPYAYLMKFAKLIRGDKEKTQKLVQMAWTFVNDSLCTALCLQWEPDIIAISLMYLASRLTKVDITDWVGKVPGQKVKWFEGLVEDSTLEILEEVCHQVLDLYSTTPQGSKEESPPPPPPPPPPKPSVSPAPLKTPTKRSRSRSPNKSSKSIRKASPVQHHRSRSPSYSDRAGAAIPPSKPAVAVVAAPVSAAPVAAATAAAAVAAQPKATSYEQTNPFMTSNMYSSSFLSGEGSNAIQTLIGGRQRPQQPAAQQPVAAVQQPVAAAPAYIPTSQYNMSQPPPQSRIPATYSGAVYPPAAAAGSYTHQYQQQGPVMGAVAGSAATAASLSGGSYPTPSHQYNAQQPLSQQPAPKSQQYDQYASYSQQPNYAYPPQQNTAPAAANTTGQAPAPPQSQAYTSSYNQPPPQAYGSAYGQQYSSGGGSNTPSGRGGRRGQGQAARRSQGLGSAGSVLTPVTITGRRQQQQQRR